MDWWVGWERFLIGPDGRLGEGGRRAVIVWQASPGKGKTIHVALSKEQYDWLKQAIANWRTVQETLRQMQRLSREELFETLPHPKRRKRLGKRVLGLV